MNVLLIGNGGREHCIAWRLAQSVRVGHVFVAPGNGGTAKLNKASNVAIGVSEIPKLVAFAVENNVKLVVAGPEQPLVDGVVDAFQKVDIPCFGPSQKAAQLEGSKAFSKDFMDRHHIPTAEYKNFTNFDEAKAYVEKKGASIVIKASGIAAGKGVLIPSSLEEAVDALRTIMVDRAFGDAGNEVVVEEFLDGEELSLLAFSDGEHVVCLPGAQDHKRIFDGDKGPNTGGMGAYSPTILGTTEIVERAKSTVLLPTVLGMKAEGNPFVGILYAGLMIDKQKNIKVLEFNCRFGDPETEVLLPLLSDETDLADVMLACVSGTLDKVHIGFRDAFAATVVAASEGYPGDYPKGRVITIADYAETSTDTFIFHAGTSIKDGALVTSGGRVLTVTGVAPTLKEALAKAYFSLSKIHFQGMQFRRDIGHRALAASS